MNARPWLRIAAESIGAGIVVAAAVNAVWFTASGHAPSLVTLLVVDEAVMAAWSIVQAVRFRWKWQTVLASYNQPALGEGIDIPGWPPVDDEEGER